MPEPVALGTDEVEAFTSFLARTALHNDLAMGLFARYVLAPILGRSDVRGASRDDWGRYFSAIFARAGGSIDANGPRARGWVAALEQASLRDRLSRLTLLWWTPVLPTGGLTRGVRWWCPVCLQQQGQGRNAGWPEPDRPPIHEPLLWRLAPVEICYRHERPVALTHNCPACDAESPVLATWGLPGQCAACGAWLGRPIEDVRAAAETAWSRYAWTECRRLIAAAQSDQPLAAATPDVAAALTTALGARARTRKRLARDVGCTVSGVSLWTSGRRKMSLPAVLRVGFILGVHVDALLQGRVEVAATGATEAPPAVVRRRVDWPAVQAHLRRAAASGRPPSVAQVAMRHGADGKEVCRRLPDLAAEVGQRHAAWRHAVVTARTARSEREIGEAVRALAGRGVYPSRERVALRLPHRADMRNPRLRAAWKRALAEAGLL